MSQDTETPATEPEATACCAYCGGQLPSSPSDRIYCSGRCAALAQRDREIAAGMRWPVTNVHTNVRGAIAELMVATDLLTRGYEVFQAFHPSSCDLLAMKDGAILRVEVKAGRLTVDGRCNKVSGVKPDKFDVLAIVVGAGIVYNRDI